MIASARSALHAGTLSSRAGEIERLVLLVAKLNQMLFGRKSEKVLRQIEQLEFQLEDLQAASAVEEAQAAAPAERPAPAEAASPSVAGASSARGSHPHAGARGLPRLRRPAP